MKLFSLLALLLLTNSTVSAAEKTPALAGWYDLFPVSSQRLLPHLDHPVVAKTKDDGQKYSQSAHFDAATGLPRSFTVTVARDPDFKTAFSKDALKKAPTETIEVGKRTAWVWADKKKVVVPLADDIAVIIVTDPRSEPMPLVEYAKSLDYDRIEKALANPPRTEFTPTLQTFEKFKKGDTALGVYQWAGPAKTREQVGPQDKQQFRWTYSLKDGSKVFVTTVGPKIEAVTHETADDKSVELLK